MAVQKSVRKKILLFTLLFFYIFIGIIICDFSKAEPTEEIQNQDTLNLNQSQEENISIWGRLVLENHDQEEWLILYTKNAEAYFIKGNLTEQLKQLFFNLGPENLVLLTGYKEYLGRTSCKREYSYDESGFLKGTLVRCIRYYELEVVSILDSKKSDEYIPPPKEDIEEEKIIKRDVIGEVLPPVIGQIRGVITKVNLKGPIKTVEIENLNKDESLKKITLTLSVASTRIVKKTGEKEMDVTLEGLRVGQEIMAIYRRDEFKSEALIITITKE